MRTRSRLICRLRKAPPSRTAIEAIAAIQRMLEQGITPEELAQARASLDAMNLPRQGQLPLAVRR